MALKDIKDLPMFLNDDSNYDVQPVGLKTFNAHHYYNIKFVDRNDEVQNHKIRFQEGPIKEYGVNGITDEHLIRIVLERIESFQDSEFKCEDNKAIIYNLKHTLLYMSNRRKERESRGVEGTFKP